MKKSSHKMQLHRDTLYRLDEIRVRGGNTVLTPLTTHVSGSGASEDGCPVSTNGNVDCCLNNHTPYSREG